MPDPTVAELREEALLLGYKTDDQVANYVLGRQAAFREERAQERELRKRELELEAPTKEAEARARESEARERESAAKERESAAKERELQAQLALVQAESGGGNPTPPALKPASIKLPLYREGDDINGFLDRFERIADMIKIPESDWSAHLGSVLSGKALDIYVSLPSNVTVSYSLLKTELLKGFNRSVEYYRSEFRSARIEAEDSFTQFVTRLRRYLGLWLDSARVRHSFDDLCDFIISDQFLAAVPSDLRVFLKEQGSLTLAELVDKAEAWASAHKVVHKSSSLKVERVDPKPVSGTQPRKYPPPFQRDDSGVQCYHCHEFGHTKSLCPILRNLAVKKEESSNVISHSKEEESLRGGICFENEPPQKYNVNGTVNGRKVGTILRDTGCDTVLISSKILPHLGRRKYSKKIVYDFLGNGSSFPVSRVYLKCPLYAGYVNAMIAPLKSCEVILGNIPGVRDVVPSLRIPKSNKMKANYKPTFHPQNSAPEVNVVSYSSTSSRVWQAECPSNLSCNSGGSFRNSGRQYGNHFYRGASPRNFSRSW